MKIETKEQLREKTKGWKQCDVCKKWTLKASFYYEVIKTLKQGGESTGKGEIIKLTACLCQECK